MGSRWCMLVTAVLLAAGPAHAAGNDESQRLLEAVANIGSFRVEPYEGNQLQLVLSDRTGHTVGGLVLIRDSRDRVPRFRSAHYGMEVSTFVPDSRVVEQLVRAAHAVAAADGGASENPQPRQPSYRLASQWWFTLFCVVLASLLGLVRRARVEWTIRPPHLIPALIQASLLCYWSLYFPGVRDRVPSLVSQLVMAFALDAAFSFARFKSWRIGASPLPVVLSSNLFIWFDPNGVIVCLVAAFASKALIRRKGNHVLNPSAFGLTVAGIGSYLWPGLIHPGGVFHTLNLTPNMAELMVLLAILPQVRFRILPVSIGAVLALRLADNPTVLYPAMILAVALLATDPATIPETDAGKALFGAFIGFGIVTASWCLRSIGVSDDFAKAMAIPVANAVGPGFDRLGAALGAARLPKRIPNLAFVTVWLSITLLPLASEKPRTFEAALHWNLGTRFVARDADDVPRCASNPLFCRPFTFAAELRRWLVW